tara:strand:+ start:451 stop:2160 length:1710 start_codon:yes stop_codon:yes gene_type:complete
MAETLLSPGVLTRENDQSIVTQGPIVAGAAIIGPAVRGPVNVPTLVTSYSDYRSRFGTSFQSSSIQYEYLTSISAYNYFQQGGASLLVTRVVTGSFIPASASVASVTSAVTSFELESITEGSAANAGALIGKSGSLASGSDDNVRWEVTAIDTGSGTFNLLIRRGNDNQQQKVVLEQYRGLSLDPTSQNYITARIGDQKQTLNGDYIQITGSFQNLSRYVRVKSVKDTYEYFNNDGTAKSEFTGSLPAVGSGSLEGAFAGGTGELFIGGGLDMFENIDDNVLYPQGINPTNYQDVIALLGNKDEYQFDIISAPGLTLEKNAGIVGELANMVQERGDAIAIVDPSVYAGSVAGAIQDGTSLDNSYAAAYWPWVQVRVPSTGKLHFVPASTIMPGVYAFSDRATAEWFAPAGFNRGGLGMALQAERKLSPTDRDNLYLANVNPIASFPGRGPVAYGQKTLQKNRTALDRVNVRRLLIELKRTIGSIANNLVFEQNTATTRNRFLSQVNPYMESIQQRQGLYAYKVVMDDTNNTADVIDRNELIGQVYVQPTKTAEFIILDFNVTPTGASFE